jgi:hypothetical protein
MLTRKVDIAKVMRQWHEAQAKARQPVFRIHIHFRRIRIQPF